MAFGVLLLVGAENIRGLFSKSPMVDDSLQSSSSSHSIDTAAIPPSTKSKVTSHTYPPPKIVKANLVQANGAVPRESMRPYKIAKSQKLGDQDRILGLVFVLLGLGMLWVVPSYIFPPDRSEAKTPPPAYMRDGVYSRRDRAENSQSSQAVLGMITLAVLLFSFALMRPAKPRKTPTDGPAVTAPVSSQQS